MKFRSLIFKIIPDDEIERSTDLLRSVNLDHRLEQLPRIILTYNMEGSAAEVIPIKIRV